MIRLLLLSLLSSTALAQDHQELRHNPFHRLVSQDVMVTASPVPNQEKDTKPILYGVLISGKHSLANVDGTILQIGETIEGLHLVSVTEDQVVVRAQGKRLTLNLGEETAGENDE